MSLDQISCRPVTTGRRPLPSAIGLPFDGRENFLAEFRLAKMPASRQTTCPETGMVAGSPENTKNSNTLNQGATENRLPLFVTLLQLRGKLTPETSQRERSATPPSVSLEIGRHFHAKAVGDKKSTVHQPAGIDAVTYSYR